MSNTELFKIVSKPFLTNKDIAVLASCSPATASRIRSKIAEQVEAEGKKMPPRKGMTHTKRVLDYLDIKVESIYKTAKMERELGI